MFFKKKDKKKKTNLKKLNINKNDVTEKIIDVNNQVGILEDNSIELSNKMKESFSMIQQESNQSLKEVYGRQYMRYESELEMVTRRIDWLNNALDVLSNLKNVLDDSELTSSQNDSINKFLLDQEKLNAFLGQITDQTNIWNGGIDTAGMSFEAYKEETNFVNEKKNNKLNSILAAAENPANTNINLKEATHAKQKIAEQFQE